MNNSEYEILQIEEPKSSFVEYICVIILLAVSIFLLIYMMKFV